jgi:hypothetical protein
MLEQLIVEPGTAAGLTGRDPRAALGLAARPRRLRHGRRDGAAPEDVWRPRLGHIREFERMLTALTIE